MSRSRLLDCSFGPACRLRTGTTSPNPDGGPSCHINAYPGSCHCNWRVHALGTSHRNAEPSRSKLPAHCHHHVREQGIWVGDRQSTDANL